MTELWADLDETFDEYTLVPDDFQSLGDYVLVTVRQGARVRGSDDRIETTIYHLWRVQAGKPHEAWSFGTRQESLEAVGLSE